MRQLNGVYTQRFNRAHKRVGHVFQGRYKAILVDKESYLLEVARYVVLNPVRAEMVHFAGQWPWSSYRQTAGVIIPYPWVATDWLLAQFSKLRKHAQAKYKEFVAAGKGLPSPWSKLKNQIYLGSDAFVENMQAELEENQCLDDVPLAQKRAVAKPLSYYEKHTASRNEAIVQAYRSGAYKMKELGDYFGVHYSTVSRIIREQELAAQ